MTEKIKKALELIEIPAGLDKDAEKGVRRAVIEEKRSRITMKKTAIIAAAFALVIAASAGFGVYSLSKSQDEVKTLRFMGYEPGTQNPVVVEVGDEGNILGKVHANSVVLKDENGQSVEPDMIFLMLAYWLDENGDLQCTDVPFGAYSFSIEDSENDKHKQYILEGFNSEDFGDQITFSPAGSYLGSVEAGTAYDVEDGELEVSLKKLSDGKMQFEFTPKDGSKYPFSAAAEYHLDSVLLFNNVDGVPGYLGGSAPGFLTDSTSGEMQTDDKADGENCVWTVNYPDNTFYVTGAKGEVNGWLKLSSIGVTLDNGKKLELHGNWIVKFTA